MDTKTARTDSSNVGHTDERPRAITTDTPVVRFPHAGRRRSTPVTLDDLSDDELAGAAAVGDAEAFSVLITRLTPGLLRYLRRMVADRPTAEDLAQDTLLDAWKGLGDFEFRSTFRTWMFSIAHRKVVDHHRRRRDVPTDAEQFVDLAAPDPLPADQVVNTSLVEALQRELATMPETSRAAWWLREAEGLSVAEIARILRISHGSARGHLQRSRSYLATRLEPWKPPEAPAGRHRPARAGPPADTTHDAISSGDGSSEARNTAGGTGPTTREEHDDDRPRPR